jgi:hypothetical protein
MNELARKLGKWLPLFLACATWDTYTTAYGTIAILGGFSFGSIIGGVLTGLVVVAVLYHTFDIFKVQPHGSEFGVMLVRGLWVICITYDLITSFYGNRVLISSVQLNLGGWMVLSCMTLIVTGSTVLASWIIHNLDNKTTKPASEV